ncbi:MAG: DUF2789 domain-containing protein [Geothrix sp.]|nr:DUF2789 domain-containing protein [Geothrix sp.]
MESHLHSMTDLFAQLGLPSNPEAIQAFIEARRPLTAPLADAPFWTPAQAAFLRDQVEQDADWADVVDRLASGLRRPTA